ncbi:MAG TPA: hypothetical protein VIS96_16735 [Terrimicrobiaceae bacterium]
MNKNTIEGRRGGTSWHNTAKSIGSVVEVNSAVVSGSNAFLPGEIPAFCSVGKSAEAVVMSREPGDRDGPYKQ